MSKIANFANYILPGMERVGRLTQGRNPSYLRSVYLGVVAPIISMPQLIITGLVAFVIGLTAVIWMGFLSILTTVMWFVTSIVLGFLGRLIEVRVVEDDKGICGSCMGSGESGPDQVCNSCEGDGADHSIKGGRD